MELAGFKRAISIFAKESPKKPYTGVEACEVRHFFL